MLIVFADMIPEMEASKIKLLILFQSTERYKAKRDTLFYFQNTYEKRTSTNSINSFVGY